MDAIETLKSRRSVRKFTSREVPKKLIETLIDAGRLAATARNEQPWEFVVVTDASLRKRLADTSDYGKFIAESPVCIVVFCKNTKYYLEDGSAATQNILVAATALRLGSCWVAGDKKPYARAIGDMLGVPKDYLLVSLIAVGYPSAPPTMPSKRSLKNVAHWEKF